MRILFFSTAFPQPDDPTQSPYNLHRCDALARLGHEVEVISPLNWRRARAGRARAGDRIGAIRVTRPVFYYPPGVLHASHAWFLWRSVRATARAVVRRFQPEIVLSYWTFPDAAVAARIARSASVPCVTMVGGSDVLSIDPEKPDGAARRVTAVLSAVNAIVTVSDHLKERICDLGLPYDKVHVLPAGVDTAMFSPGDRIRARRALGIEDAARALVWVGRMVEVKALDLLLAATRSVADSRPNVRLYLIGDGPLRASLEAQTRDLGLAGRVTFVGRVTQALLAEWYRAVDLTVLPSHWEGTPNVLLESHACGIPFVATRVGAIPQLALEGIDGLVPPADAGALAEGICAALDRCAARSHAAAPLNVSGWDEAGTELARVLASVHGASPVARLAGLTL